MEDTVETVEWVDTGRLFATGAAAALAGLNFIGSAVGTGGAPRLAGAPLVVDRTLEALLATELTEAPEILLVRSLTGDTVFDLPPPMRMLAVDVVDVWRVREVGVEMVEVLVLAVRYEPVFSVAVEAVDIGRVPPPEMDRVETREVGRDTIEVPAFPVLFVEIVKRERAVECVLPRELGREEEVKLAEEGDVRMDDEVVVDLRMGV